MFQQHVVQPAAFAKRFVELLPEYLPGVDTGAFEATDRRRCWNKTLKNVLTVIGEEDNAFDVAAQEPSLTIAKDQCSFIWRKDGMPVFVMKTGWGDRSDLETSLEWLLSFKCPQKLLVYSCGKWQEAVQDQIRAALLRYPYHIAGEQYLFMNLVGAENRFHLLTADLEQSGRLSSLASAMLRAVPGSPFSWTTKHAIAG